MVRQPDHLDLFKLTDGSRDVHVVRSLRVPLHLLFEQEMHFVAQDEGDKLNKDLGMQGFVRLDTVTPVGLQAFCRTAIVLFFCGNEGLSIVENLGIMGLPLPGFVKTKFEQLKAKGNPDENSPEE